jgi:hypothetical protein
MSMSTRDEGGKFLPGVSGNPGGRTTAASRRVRQLLEADAEQYVQMLKKAASEGDSVALRIVFDRINPPAKAVAESVELPALFCADTFDAKAQALLDSVARGELPPDIGAQMLGALSAVLRVHEIDELVRRIAALENAGKPPTPADDLL